MDDTLALVPLLLALAGCAAAQAPDEERTAAAVAWLRERGAAPVDYVTGKFDDFQCVLVGEMHEIRENCAFVAACLPPAFEKGVLVLGTEFLRARHTDAMNRLLGAPEYDEAAVVALMRDGPWPTWGFQDYADVFRAVWQLNHDKATDGPGLRVLGLDSEWTQHELWFGGVSPRERMRILLEREQTMIAQLADGPLLRGEKVLVHCGYAHSVTCHGARLGTVLSQRFPDKVFQVALHHDLRTRTARSWLTEWLERVVTEAGRVPVGFDLGAAPFADLRDRGLPQWQLVPDAGIGDLCQGYVFLVPIDALQRVRWIPGFLTPETFAVANALAVRMGHVSEGECGDAAALDAKLLLRYPRQ